MRSSHHGRQRRQSSEDRGGDDKHPPLRLQHHHHNRDGVITNLNHDVLQPVRSVAGTRPAEDAGQPRAQIAVSAGGRHGGLPRVPGQAPPPEDAASNRVGRRPVQRTPRDLRTRILSTVGYVSPGFLRSSHARRDGKHDPAQRRVLAGLSERSAEPTGLRLSKPEHRMGPPTVALAPGDGKPPAVPDRNQAAGTCQDREPPDNRGTDRTRRRREQRRRNRERRRRQSSPSGSEQCPSCGGSGRAGERPRDRQRGGGTGGAARSSSRSGGSDSATAGVHYIPRAVRASSTGSVAGKPPTSVHLRLGRRVPEHSGVAARV